MSNCDKKGIQLLVEENEAGDRFIVSEVIDGKQRELGTFVTPEEVEEFFEKLEKERPDDTFVLRCI